MPKIIGYVYWKFISPPNVTTHGGIMNARTGNIDPVQYECIPIRDFIIPWWWNYFVGVSIVIIYVCCNITGTRVGQNVVGAPLDLASFPLSQESLDNILNANMEVDPDQGFNLINYIWDTTCWLLGL